jgi:hypothetical protein
MTKITVLWVVTPYCLHLHPEDRGRTFLRNSGNYQSTSHFTPQIQIFILIAIHKTQNQTNIELCFNAIYIPRPDWPHILPALTIIRRREGFKIWLRMTIDHSLSTELNQ